MATKRLIEVKAKGKGTLNALLMNRIGDVDEA